MNPPDGPITSTYKTLTEVEPRTPISTVPFTITQGGSYYLTRNLTVPAGQVGISVNARNVTLDLNGYRLEGASGSDDLIRVAGSGVGYNAKIRNGALRGMGADAIDAGASEGVVVDDISIDSSSGPNSRGVVVGRGSILRNIYVRNISGVGISTSFSCNLRDCVVEFSNGGGFLVEGNSVVTNCAAAGIQGTAVTGNGFSFGTGVVAIGCNSRSNQGSGFVVTGDSLLTDCSSTNNTNHGLNVTGANTGGSTIRNCTFAVNGGVGVRLDSAGNTLDSCTIRRNSLEGVSAIGPSNRILNNLLDLNGQASGNQAGISLIGILNSAERNRVVSGEIGILTAANSISTVRGNSCANNSAGNYQFNPGTLYGPIVTAPSGGDLSTFANGNHPDANLAQ